MKCFATRQEAVNSGVAPLLLSRPWSMPSPPGRHSAVVRLLECGQRDSCRLRLLLERLGVGKEFLKGFCVRGGFGGGQGIGLEGAVGLGIFEREAFAAGDFAFSGLAGRFRKSCEISLGAHLFISLNI